jgi:tRNA pseudouridine55 synthase
MSKKVCGALFVVLPPSGRRYSRLHNFHFIHNVKQIMQPTISSSGIILLDKTSGPSSAKTLSILKKRLCELGHVKNLVIGHAGTLDPLASGLLVALIGRATKLSNYAMHGEKIYCGEFLLGLKTDSDDISGKVESDNLSSLLKDPPKLEKVLEAVKALLGVEMQIPPKYSAIKIAGVPAYRLARQGKNLELEARKIEIKNFDISPYNLALERYKTYPSHLIYSYTIRCSSGTYVRALIRDLGDILECQATTLSIRRLASHPFTVAQAVSPIDFKDEMRLSPVLLFQSLPEVILEDEMVKKLERGEQNFLAKPDFVKKWIEAQISDYTSKLLRYATKSGEFRGLLERDQDIWRLKVWI